MGAGGCLEWEEILQAVNSNDEKKRLQQKWKHLGESVIIIGANKEIEATIRKVLFDRGFYIWHLIDYLESKREGKPLPYLILVPQNDAIKGFIDKSEGSLGILRHYGEYKKEKSKWKPSTTIVVCKNAGKDKHGKPYDMVFATNLKPSFSLVMEYKKRWNIETGFRVMEEGKIKTKSNNPLVRLFYFLLRCLLALVWMLNNILRAYHTYKSYLRNVEYKLRREEGYKPPPVEIVY